MNPIASFAFRNKATSPGSDPTAAIKLGNTLLKVVAPTASPMSVPNSRNETKTPTARSWSSAVGALACIGIGGTVKIVPMPVPAMAWALAVMPRGEVLSQRAKRRTPTREEDPPCPDFPAVVSEVVDCPGCDACEGHEDAAEGEDGEG